MSKSFHCYADGRVMLAVGLIGGDLVGRLACLSTKKSKIIPALKGEAAAGLFDRVYSNLAEYLPNASPE